VGAEKKELRPGQESSQLGKNETALWGRGVVYHMKERGDRCPNPGKKRQMSGRKMGPYQGGESREEKISSKESRESPNIKSGGLTPACGWENQNGKFFLGGEGIKRSLSTSFTKGGKL